MLFKKIKYTDYNGQQREETYCFNLNRAEVMALELKAPGGLSKTIAKAQAEQNMNIIFDIFTNLILKSYGVVSDDGKKFVKSDEISAEFEQTAAYDALFTELVTTEKASEDFLKAVMPVEAASK